MGFGFALIFPVIALARAVLLTRRNADQFFTGFVTPRPCHRYRSFRTSQMLVTEQKLQFFARRIG
jgi:hypothetical protein